MSGALAENDERTQNPTDPADPMEVTDIYIVVEHIALIPKLAALRAARPVTAEGVAELARTISEEGQLQPVLVRPLPARPGVTRDWELVYGHRRLAACRSLGIKVRAIARDLDDDEALRAALLEGWQREDFMVADRARHVAMLRAEYGWTGPRGTKLIAKHLGVSEATVTQMDRLAAIDSKTLAKVDAGEMTARAALELAPVREDKRPAVSARAQELADEAEKAVQERRKALSPGKTPPDRATGLETPGNGSLKRAKVEGRHVRQAARETKGALERPHAPGKAEIKAWWQAHEGPIYPRVLAKFVTAHLEWMDGGKGKTDKWLEAALEDIADELQKAGQKPDRIPTGGRGGPSQRARKKQTEARARADLRAARAAKKTASSAGKAKKTKGKK